MKKNVRRLGAAFGVVMTSVMLSLGASAGDVTNDRLLNSEKEPGNWLNHHGNLEAHRFSGLDQINAKNVKNLRVAFTWAMGGTQGGGKEVIQYQYSGLEGTPVAEDGFLYLTTGWGVVTKLDTRGGTPRMVWQYNPAADPDYATTVACCGINNRGAVLSGNMVVSPVIDGRIIALNKTDGSKIWEAQVADPGKSETITNAPLIVKDMVVTGMAGAEYGVLNKTDGSKIWEAQVADPGKSETITNAPLIVKDMVVTGMAGAEYGVRGWLEALDIKTGKRRWRTYTIPGPGEAGHETWKDKHGAWKTGGGSTWVTGSYDPELNIIVWGTANPGPDWDNAYRPGDNLWTDSTIALDADTGKIKWGFQHTPNDPYDYDSVSENTFVDTQVNGKFARTTLHANRNGYAYALDRKTGECLWGTQFVDKLNWSGGLDSKCKPKTYDPKSDVQNYVKGTAAARGTATKGRGTMDGVLEPGHMGGKNWPPTSYSPQTGMYYIPTIEGCNKAFAEVTEPGALKPRQLFLGGAPFSTFDDPNCGRISGSITAIEVASGKVVKKAYTKHPQLGGLLSTAGGLVFSAMLKAKWLRTMQTLWKNCGDSKLAQPSTHLPCLLALTASNILPLKSASAAHGHSGLWLLHLNSKLRFLATCFTFSLCLKQA